MEVKAAQSFAQWPYHRAEYEKIATEIRKNRLRLRLSLSPAVAIQSVKDFQAILRYYYSQAAVARIRHDQHTDDPFYAAEQDYYDQTDAQISQQTQSFYSTMLGSRHRKDLEEHYGSLIFRKAQNLQDTVRQNVVDDLSEENRLASAYLQKMSAAAIPMDDHTFTIAQLEPLQQSPDRQVRVKTFVAYGNWLESQKKDLDQLFDQLVATRTKISRKLGCSSFTELGYKRLERFDYQRSQVEELRQAVIRYIVPLTQEIRRLQRRRLGVDHLYFYDWPCLFPAGNPQMLIPFSKLPDQLDQALSTLTKTEPSFFRTLIAGGYLDLASRANKTPGGYCSTVINAGLPFILMNASGTAQDVSVLLHEAGHAYASMRSMADPTLLEYHQPTLETCEIHSTALEFLSYPLMERFFGPDAGNYALMHMTEALLFIPYGCLVDEFQHIIYDQPKLLPEQRHEIWRNLEKIYLPDLDYDQEPFHASGGGWQKKEHIFVSPFYYIDYVLAQIVALDLWQLSRKTPDKAWRSYDKLCGLGGRDTFLQLLKKAGLDSPFDMGTIKRVAFAACSFLDL